MDRDRPGSNRNGAASLRISALSRYRKAYGAISASSGGITVYRDPRIIACCSPWATAMGVYAGGSGNSRKRRIDLGWGQ